MSMNRGTVLDAGHRAFILQGVSIVVASRDASMRPAACRACGCRVGEDGRVTVFLPASPARKLLGAIESSATIAVVFSEPKSHRTIQLKATDARVAVLTTGDRTIMQQYAAEFVAEVSALGYTATMAGALVQVSEDDAAAVTFTPTSIFDQTPGPAAGEPIAVRS